VAKRTPSAPDARASDSLFYRSLAVSAALHAALLAAGGFGVSFDSFAPAEGLVVDLTLPLTGVDSPGAGPLGLPPSAPPLGAPEPPAVVAAPHPAAETPAAVEPAAEPRPASEPVVEPAPASLESAAAEAASAPSAGESSPGPSPAVPAPASVSGGSPLGISGGEGSTPGAGPGPEGGGGTGPAGRSESPEVLPVLLNKDEVLKNLRRFYPEAERAAGREAEVIVKILIGVSGRVESVDVLRSGGTAFDEGAASVARRMRFSPAILQGRPVAVAVPQRILFRLE